MLLPARFGMYLSFVISLLWGVFFFELQLSLSGVLLVGVFDDALTLASLLVRVRVLALNSVVCFGVIVHNLYSSRLPVDLLPVDVL
jgi:hypothetical protein